MILVHKGKRVYFVSCNSCFFYSMISPPEPEGVIGAMFPDMTLLTDLRWPHTHKRAVDFYDYLAGLGEIERYRSFITGFLSHAVDSGGLDYYCDEKYPNYHRGYAYLWAEGIVGRVVEACGIPDEMGVWKAHNFVEMGIESLVASENPGIGGMIGEVLDESSNMRGISAILGDFYDKPRGYFAETASGFRDFVIPSGDPALLARSYKNVLFKRHGIENCSVEGMEKIILHTRELMESRFMDFLEESRKKFMDIWAKRLGL